MNSRSRLLNNNTDVKSGPVVYLMHRALRIHDNWAFLLARRLSAQHSLPLSVIYLCPRESVRTPFITEGIKTVSRALSRAGIEFHLIKEEADEKLPFAKAVSFITGARAGAVVTDFSPLKDKRKLAAAAAQALTVPFYEVDSHNIVPAWITSAKEEYAAYTIRPKLNRLMFDYTDEFPEDEFSIPEESGAQPDKAAELLHDFIDTKMDKYHELRNDPNAGYTSGLSPYINLGLISVQRIVLEVHNALGGNGGVPPGAAAFLEELIIRRELAENYCFYNPDYDNFNGFPAWAKATLMEHLADRREFIYTVEEFENGSTHEDLWNAAQLRLKADGALHGYMRMYWAKKILEWSKTPKKAMETAVYLNDKYAADGCSPNGYAGCAWAVGGVHDRPWFEREVFGKIRYMNRSGAARKFDVKEYVGSLKF